MTYIYLQSEKHLWTTGFYEGDKWNPDKDFDSEEDAGNRCNFLNGGGIETVSTEALLAELKRRNETPEPELPQPVAVPDLGVLKLLCEKYITGIWKKEKAEKLIELEGDIFEAGLTAIFGEEIWNLILEFDEGGR